MTRKQEEAVSSTWETKPKPVTPQSWEQPGNHCYWQTKGSNGLDNGHSNNSLWFLKSFLCFFPLRRDSDSLHRLHSPSHSHPLIQQRPAVHRAAVLCEWQRVQWGAVERSTWRNRFEIRQVLFFELRRVLKSSTPSAGLSSPVHRPLGTHSHHIPLAHSSVHLFSIVTTFSEFKDTAAWS